MRRIAPTGSGEPLGCLPDPKTHQNPKIQGFRGSGGQAPLFPLFSFCRQARVTFAGGCMLTVWWPALLGIACEGRLPWFCQLHCYASAQTSDKARIRMIILGALGAQGPRGPPRVPVGPLGPPGPQAHCDGSTQKMNPHRKLHFLEKWRPVGPLGRPKMAPRGASRSISSMRAAQPRTHACAHTQARHPFLARLPCSPCNRTAGGSILHFEGRPQLPSQQRQQSARIVSLDAPLPPSAHARRRWRCPS